MTDAWYLPRHTLDRVSGSALIGAALLLMAAFAGIGHAEGRGDAARSGADTAQLRQWILEMKGSDRGPFARIRWFCKDGRVLEPKDYACAQKGEGWQHGELNERARQLRAQGYYIANVLAGLDARSTVTAPDFPAYYSQLLVEKYLVATNDGWIFHKARSYRGAIQEEDERDAARALLVEMSAREDWIGWRLSALRAGVRLLPHGRDTASAQKVRNMAATLAELDPAFTPLRVKIHGSPEASDAKSVRNYAARAKSAELQNAATALADAIDRMYAASPLPDTLARYANQFRATPWLQTELHEARDALQ